MAKIHNVCKINDSVWRKCCPLCTSSQASCLYVPNSVVERTWQCDMQCSNEENKKYWIIRHFLLFNLGTKTLLCNVRSIVISTAITKAPAKCGDCGKTIKIKNQYLFLWQNPLFGRGMFIVQCIRMCVVKGPKPKSTFSCKRLMQWMQAT